VQSRVIKADRLIEELKHTLILQNLSRRELKRFAAICELREYEANERLVEQDTIGNDLHILIEGVVDIAVKGTEKGTIKVSEVRKGDVLGEASIFMSLPRTADAIARGPCLVAAVPRDSLFSYCDANPRAGLKIFTFVIYSLLRRLGSTTHELALERESIVTREDLDRLHEHFPKSLEDMLGSTGRWPT
jgi:CRP-like cAMP-binding protein